MDLKRSLAASPCVGIGLDESNDQSSEKHCMFIIRHVPLQMLTPNKNRLTILVKSLRQKYIWEKNLGRNVNQYTANYFQTFSSQIH